jgi:hypothetical protein
MVEFGPTTHYRCAACGSVYELKCDADWDDGDAKSELERTFPSATVENCAVVCDLCYRNIILAETSFWSVGRVDLAQKEPK